MIASRERAIGTRNTGRTRCVPHAESRITSSIGTYIRAVANGADNSAWMVLQSNRSHFDGQQQVEIRAVTRDVKRTAGAPRQAVQHLHGGDDDLLQPRDVDLEVARAGLHALQCGDRPPD